ncbi:hypothetical protein MPL1032_220067 [Mesorhizobium plurifarium]|uniref:Uncharacterized protein n=1 Tax=Mesorhizobium plurifarium TaxID=69974 RepID=A0A0K2VYY1_MESPL|nr:hypothetical protein MPL1032_220067 [Mesorhizobium plurifarium]
MTPPKWCLSSLAAKLRIRHPNSPSAGRRFCRQLNQNPIRRADNRGADFQKTIIDETLIYSNFLMSPFRCLNFDNRL